MKIGMRIVKTVIAVFIAISIYVLLLLVDNLFGYDHQEWQAPSNMYTPFFAGIAAVYALHKDKKSSFNQAKVRCLGSIVGGYFGMLLILIAEYIFITILNFEKTHFILYKLIIFTIVSLGIIPLIVITVKFKQKPAVFITCLTYLSVTISIRNGGMPVFQFATNRILSTLVGAFISLGVNNISLLRNKNEDILFVSSLDNNFINSKGNINDFIKYELNTLYYNKISLSFVTTRTLTSLESIFEEVEVTFPMVVMNGAAEYDFETKKYNNVIELNYQVRKLIDEQLLKHNLNAFVYTFYENDMRSYHNKLLNEGEIDYYKKRNVSKNMYFVRGILPEDINPTQYVIIDKLEKLEKFINELRNLGCDNDLDFIVYKYPQINDEDFYYLKINSTEATKENRIDLIYKRYNFSKMIVCGSGRTDLKLIENADFSICLRSAPEYV
ncbi:MAG: HAD hydrolase family protein, partial [Bacilli bacterium]|nr:HAD hydrolase family protein [Bacilli bacterium]